jgi:hypothetical protein
MERREDMSSILNDVKHALGHPETVTAFDQDLILYINSAFGTLNQLGVGTTLGFQIADAQNSWEEFFTDPRLNAVKSYIILCVKMSFDPPKSGFATDAMERQKKELEYRLNVVADYG